MEESVKPKTILKQVQTYYIHTYRVKRDSTPTFEPCFQVYPLFGQYYTEVAVQQTVGRTGSNNNVNEVR